MADYTVQDLQDNLDYLNNTKQIIKQSIINKGQSISDTDTFRSYADKISAIETGKGDVKLFETEEAMQADTKAEEGDLAVVYKNEINIDTFKGLYEYDSNYKDTNSIQLVNISNTEIAEYSENFSFIWNNSFGTVIDLSKLKKCLDKMNEDLSKSNFYIFVKDNEIYASPYDNVSNNISNVYILNTGEIIGLGPNLAAYKDLSTLPSVQMYKLNLDTSTYTLYQTINVSQTTYKRDKTYYFYYYPFIPDTFCLYGYNNLTNELNYCLIFPNNDGTYKLIPSNINVNMDKSYLVSSKYILAPTQLTLAASNELLSGKIAYGKNGVVTGTLKNLDTSDATATSDDIINPKTAYVKGEKVTGNIVATTEPLGTNCNRLITTIDNTNIIGASNSDGIILFPTSNSLQIYKYDFDNNSINLLTTISTTELSDRKIKMTDCMYDENNNWCVLITYAKSNDEGDKVHIAELTCINNTFTLKTELAVLGNSNFYFASPQFVKNINNDIFVIILDTNRGTGYRDTCAYMSVYKVTYIPFSGEISYTSSLNRTKVIDDDFLYDYGSQFNSFTYNVSDNGNAIVSIGFDRTGKGNYGLYQAVRMNSTLDTILNKTTIVSGLYDTFGIAYKDLIIRLTEKYNSVFEFTISKWNGSNYNVLKTVRFDLVENFNNTNNRIPMIKLVDNMMLINVLFTDDTSKQFIVYIENDDLRLGEIYNIPIAYSYDRPGPADNIQTNKKFAILKSDFTTNNTYLYELQNDGVRRVSLTDSNYTYYNTYNADSTSNNVLNGKTFYNMNGKQVGTMPNNGTLNYTPNTTQQTIPAGYTSGGTVAGDSNLIPENIKKDVSIFNVVGTMSGDTATYNYETTDYTISHIDSTDAVTYMDVLQDYALIEFTGPRVDLYHKVDNTWTLLKNITTKSIEAADGSQDSISKGTSRIIKVENNIVYTYTGVIDTAAKIIGYIFTYNINTQELDKHVIENTTSDSVGTVDIMTYNSNYMITGLSEKTVTWYSIDFDNYTITEIDEDYSGRGHTAIKNNVWLSTLYYRTGYIFNTASGTAQEFGDINMDGSIAAILFDETKVIKNDGNVYEINVEWQIGNKVGESNYLDVFTNNEKLYCINSKYYMAGDNLYELTVSDTTYTFTLVTTNTNIARCNNTIYLETPAGDEPINDFYEFIPGTTIVSMNYAGDVWYNHPIYNGATSDKVLSGNYTYDQNHNVVQGTMPNKGDLTVTPSLSDQNFGEGYYSSITVNEVTSAIDSDIKPENIKDGVNILGVVGTLETGLDTSDATATAEDIAEDKTAYVKGQKITGSVMTTAKGASPAWQTHDIVSNSGNGALYASTIISNGDKPRLYQGSNKLSLTLSWEDVSNVIGLTPEKLVAGNTIIGVEGTATSLDTSDANATAEDIAEDKTAYVNGQKITGTIPTAKYGASSAWSTNEVTKRDAASALDLATYISVNNPEQPVLFKGNNKLTLSAGYEKVAEVIGLTAEKIKSGETILGVEGTYEGNAGDDVSNYINLQPTETTITFSNLIKVIPQINTQNVTSMKSMFQNLINIATIPQLDTSNVKNMNSMFYGCTSLESIPNLTTSSVTNMGSMFYGCTNIATIPQLDTSNVTDMSNMFYKCTNLESIPNLTTSKVTTTCRMFAMCSNITTVPQLNTSNVTNISQMFDRCSSLKNIPLLDTNKVTNMLGMVNACTSFTNTDLNTVLQMCANAVNVTSNKTLEYIGLSHDQASICKTLSNYSAFTEAGWTTGWSDLD